MAFLDKDPNKAGPKNGAPSPWSGARLLKLKSAAGLVPTMAMTQVPPESTGASFLDAAKSPGPKSPGLSTVKLTPLIRRPPSPTGSNAAKQESTIRPFAFPTRTTRNSSCSQSEQMTPLVRLVSTLAKPTIARTLSFSTPSDPNEELASAKPSLAFEIYRDHDAQPNIWDESSRPAPAMAPIVGLSDSWDFPLGDGAPSPDAAQHHKFLRAGMNSPSSLGGEDSFDYERAEHLTNDMFRLLFGSGIEGETAVPVETNAETAAPAVTNVWSSIVNEPHGEVETVPKIALIEADIRATVPVSEPRAGASCLFEMWEDIKDEYSIDELIPYRGPMTRPDYANVIADYVAMKTADGAKRAKYVLVYMLLHYKRGVLAVRPDGGCYNKVLHGFAESRMPAKAEEIMNLMCSMFDEGDIMAQPNTRHYTTLLYAWQRSKQPDAPEHCEQILEKMHEMHETLELVSCKPDAFSYTTVLHCWADSGRPDAPQRAEALFRKMKHFAQQGDEGLSPDSIAYSNLINVVASGQGYARAADILFEMVDDYLNGNAKCKPRIRNLNTILSVWSKSNAPYAPERAEEIVKRWLHLNKTTFMDVKPDEYSYSLLLKCWATSSRPDAPERAEQTLWWLQKLGKQGDSAAKLNTIKYTTVLTAWISRKKWKAARALFEMMTRDFLNGNKVAKPDYSTFQKILDGLLSTSMVNDADSLLRTTWLLSSRAGDCVTFNCAPVLMAWGHAGLPERAEILLKDMQVMYDEGRLNPGPSKQLYRTLVTVWSKSKAHDRASRICSLQDKMDRFFPQGRHEQVSTVSNKNIRLFPRGGSGFQAKSAGPKPPTSLPFRD